MAESKLDKFTAVLAGAERYGLEIDSALRTIGHAMPADVWFKWAATLDDSSPNFKENVLKSLSLAHELSSEIKYDIAYVDEPSDGVQEKEFQVALRIRFTNQDAAFYLFSNFPGEDLDYVGGCSRKRDGDSHVMLLTLPSRKHLDNFIEVCRRNPHFVGAEIISEEEFWKAPSNSG
jgi:hypothetical protein